MSILEKEIDALEVLLKAATPGPWSIDHRLSDSTIQGALEPGCGNYAAIIASEQGMRTDAPRFSANAALIVAMRNSIERLLSDRARMREALTEIAANGQSPDWVPYNDYGGYNSYALSDGRLEGVDDSNNGDVHDHGFACGQENAAAIARAALAAAGEGT